jgi:hypothetical protein
VLILIKRAPFSIAFRTIYFRGILCNNPTHETDPVDLRDASYATVNGVLFGMDSEIYLAGILELNFRLASFLNETHLSQK